MTQDAVAAQPLPGAPAQAQLPAVQQLPPDPNLGYWYALLDLDDQEEVLESIAEDCEELFVEQMNAIITGAGLEEMSAREALSFLASMTRAELEEQKAKYPEDYEKDQEQYQRLLDRAGEGKL